MTTSATPPAAPDAPAHILIVDDEAPARKRLSNLLDDCREAFALQIADQVANGREAIDAVNKGGIDIVLCDIRMPVMDGIEFARHLATLDSPPKLIFTTAFDQYAVKAFELNAVDYLLKPIKQERLLAALLKARPVLPPAANAIADATHSKRKHLSIHERGKVVLLPTEEIMYLKAELKYITVRTQTREYLLEESLTRLEEEFVGTFVRIHRNALVSINAIAGFERVPIHPPTDDTTAPSAEGVADDVDVAGMHWVCILRGIPETLPVSRRQQHLIREF